MKKPGLLRTLLLIVAPVAILMAVSSRYPTMIERRIEQTKKHREAPVQPSEKVVTLEIISPDGKARPELERAARSTDLQAMRPGEFINGRVATLRTPVD